MSVPTFLQGKTIVVIETLNGFAVAPSSDARIEECVAFETWDALTYYLAQNYAPRNP